MSNPWLRVWLRLKPGATTVITAGQAFERIHELVDQVAKDTQAAAVSIASVSTMTKDVASHIQTVEELGIKMVDDISHVSAAAQEQNAAMQEIAAASAQLTSLAENLDQAVNKFHS